MRKKVGIMGGTFDPIHIGHLILGENAYHQFDLDSILYMPSGNPPHKQNRTGRATAKERGEMVSLAIADNPHFTLCDIELESQEYSYTRASLEKLTAMNPNTDYYFIMGADSLFQFNRWKDPQRICELCTIITAVRDDIPDEQMNQQITLLEQQFNGCFLRMNAPNIDISSDELRQHIRGGHSLRYYMPESVAKYIRDNGLYHEVE